MLLQPTLTLPQNWFQNRRAKAKHEAKQAARLLKLERSQPGEPTTEDYDLSKEFLEIFEEEQQFTSEDQSKRPRSGSTHAAASYDLKYEASVAANSHSLQRAELNSQTVYQRGNYDFEFDCHTDWGQFGATIYESMAEMDHSQFPNSVSANMADYDCHVFTTATSVMENLDRQATVMSMSRELQTYKSYFPVATARQQSKPGWSQYHS